MGSNISNPWKSSIGCDSTTLATEDDVNALWYTLMLSCETHYLSPT